MTCEVCGADIAPGKKFCTLCGAPVAMDAGFRPLQPAKPAPQAPPPQAQQPPPATAPGVDASLINDILESEEKKQAKKTFPAPWKHPQFWTGLAALILAPSMALPWLRLYPGNELGAFNLPVSFLLTGQNAGLPALSAGAVMAAAFIAIAALSFLLGKNKTGSYLKIIAAILIILPLLTPLFALRSWKAFDGAPDDYPAYVQSQRDSLTAATGGANRFFGTGEAKAPPASLKDFGTARGLDFVMKTLGPGFLFALAAGVILIGTTVAFRESLKFYAFFIPPTPLAAILAVFVLMALAGITRFFFPARWYQTSAAIYQAGGMRDKEEQALISCSKLPVPSLACKTALAKTYYDTNRKPQALELFKHISHSFPKYSEPDKYIGSIYLLRKDYETAAHHLRKYTEQHSMDSEAKKKLSDALFALGSEYLKKGYYTTAVERLKESYSLLPENAKNMALNYKLGSAYKKIRDHQKAAGYMARAADLDKKVIDMQSEAADEFMLAGNYESAVKYYQQCVDAEPRKLNCYILGGDVYRDYLDDAKTALQWYKTGIEKNDVDSLADELRKRIKELE